jgi:hypothetical protein
LLLRHFVFGEEATYRVLQTRGELVNVEVVTAVGLPPGTQLKLTVASATEMRATPVASRVRPAAGSPLARSPRGARSTA